MTEAGLDRPKATEQAAALPGSTGLAAPPEHDPERTVVPNTLLGLAGDELSPTDDLLWEWARWSPPALPISLLAGPFDTEDNPWWWTDVAPEPDTVPPVSSAGGGEATKDEKTELEAETVPMVPAAGAGTGDPGKAETVADQAGQAGSPPIIQSPVEPQAVGLLPVDSDAGGEQPDDRPEGGSADLATDTGLSTWGQRVREATARRVRAPRPMDPTPVTTAIEGKVQVVQRREGVRRSGAKRDLHEVLPMAPDLPAGLPPPPPIPLPAVETKVTGTLGRTLPQQVLPALREYTHTPESGKPQVFRPQLPPLRLPAGSVSVLTPIPPPPRAGREGKAKVDAVRQAGAGITPVPVATGAFTLGTVPAPGAPGAPPAPRVAKADIATVLARLRNSIPADTKAMLAGIREGMYRQRALQMQLPTLGENELLPELQTKVSTAIDAIATQAGIDLNALHTATVTEGGKVTLGEDKTKAAVTEAEAEAKKKTQQEGAESSATEEGIAAAKTAEIDLKLLEAQGGASPAQIRAQRDRLVARVHRRLAPEDLRYEREGADRLNALSLMAAVYEGGYTDVARQVADRIRRDTQPDPTTAASRRRPSTPTTAVQPPPPQTAPAPLPSPSAEPATPAEAWVIDRIREVRVVFGELRKEAEQATALSRGKIADAREFARAELASWAEREIGDRSSFWEALWDKIHTWGKEAQDQTLAWEEARAATLGADLRGDIAFVADMASGARSEAEMKAIGALGGLSEAQKAIVAAYFTAPPPRDPLSAVSAGMRVRITEVHRPRLTEQLEQMLYALPKDRWLDVAIVAEADGDNNVSILTRGRQFYAAVDQWGTDESKLYESLTGLTRLQRHALDLWYQAVHGSTIDEELEDELEDAELDRAQALMRGDEIAADAAAIRDAIEGPGTDEAEIYRALRNKSAEDRARLEAIYLERYHVTLAADIDSDMDGEEQKRAEALRQGDVARADAIGLQAAQSGKWYGGADTDEIQAIYAQNRKEVEDQARAQGWTGDELKRQVLARNQKIDEAHKVEYRTDSGDPGPGLRASFEKNLTGPVRDLALGLQDQDWARADAARLELEKRSFITDDKVVNKILESQYERAETEVRLDVEHQLAYRQDLAAVRGEKWDAKAEREKAEAEIVDKAKERSTGYMTALQSTYDKTYKYDPLSEMHGRGGFDNLINDHLMGSDKDRAKHLAAHGGYLNAAEEIKFAVQGPGTDVDVLRQKLAGKTKAQIAAIEAEWKVLYPNGPTLRDRIMEDVSGRDAVDLDEMLTAPETPAEKLASVKRRQKFEHQTFSLGSTFSNAERSALDEDVARLELMVAELERADKPEGEGGDPKKAEFYRWRVDQEVRAVDSAIDEHRRAADSVTDKLAMAAAVIAGAVVTALTWGAAGPFVAGALGALAAAEATILTKMAVKGAAYSEEELLVDVVSGAVDVIMALATAGVGNALLRVSKAGVPVGRLAKLATSASRAKRMVAHGLANGIEGMIGGIPSGAAGALADEKTWTQGNVLTTVFTGAAMGGGSGLVMGGLIGSAGGWSGPPVPLHLPAGSTAEAVGRAAQWHTHQAQHPGASYADFAADFDAGRIAPDPASVTIFQKAAREHLASGLPQADRKLLEGVSVTVLTDAEFARVTRSASGQAVTVVEQGKVRIVMRESAPLSALREEGIHAAQALDPAFAKHFKILDEANLAGWDKLDLRTKLAAYAAKLDLEIDANARLLAGLREEIDALPPGAARTALIDQADATSRTLDTLGSRRVELASFGPLDRLKARLGVGTLATRLDQPARLFTKGKSAVGPAKKVTKLKAKAAKAPVATGAPTILPPDPATWGKPPEKGAPRRALSPDERGPRLREKEVVAVDQVGAEWRELSWRGKPPKEGLEPYRRLEVTIEEPGPPPTRRIEYVDETVVRGSDPPRWVRRGKDSGEAGAIAEEASLAQTRRYIEAMREKGVTVVTLGPSLQNESGHGFDEVYLEFHPDGRVEIVVVEVKDYRRRLVPFKDFTAVSTNLHQNLQTLTDRLARMPRRKLPPGFRDLDTAQLRAMRERVAGLTGSSPGITLEVRTGPTTGLGGQIQQGRKGTALRKLEALFPERAVRRTPLAAAEVDLAREIASLELPDASAARLLDAHKSLVAKGLLDKTLEPVPGQPGIFIGKSGDATTFRAVTAEEVGSGMGLDRQRIEAIAQETVAALQRRVEVPGVGTKDLKVILDVAGLDLHTRLWLEHAIDRTLEAIGRASELKPRLHIE